MDEYLIAATLQLTADSPDEAQARARAALRGLRACDGLKQVYADHAPTLFSPDAFEQMTGQTAMDTDTEQ